MRRTAIKSLGLCLVGCMILGLAQTVPAFASGEEGKDETSIAINCKAVGDIKTDNQEIVNKCFKLSKQFLRDYNKSAETGVEVDLSQYCGNDNICHYLDQKLSRRKAMVDTYDIKVLKYTDGYSLVEGKLLQSGQVYLKVRQNISTARKGASNDYFHNDEVIILLDVDKNIVKVINYYEGDRVDEELRGDLSEEKFTQEDLSKLCSIGEKSSNREYTINKNKSSNKDSQTVDQYVMTSKAILNNELKRAKKQQKNFESKASSVNNQAEVQQKNIASGTYTDHQCRVNAQSWARVNAKKDPPCAPVGAPTYHDFGDATSGKSEGGDCVNFASNALIAGGFSMKYDGNNKWYINSGSDSSSSWRRCSDFREFLVENDKDSNHAPGGSVWEQDGEALTEYAQDIDCGNIIQVKYKGASTYGHTLVIVDKRWEDTYHKYTPVVYGRGGTRFLDHQQGLPLCEYYGPGGTYDRNGLGGDKYAWIWIHYNRVNGVG